MDKFDAVVLTLMAILAAFVFSGLMYEWGVADAMQNAFDHGKSVQCIGRSGYFFTCEDQP